MDSSNVYSGDCMRIGVLLPFYIVASAFRRFGATFGEMFRGTTNWWSVLLLYWELRRRVTIRYKNGMEFSATKGDLGKAISLAEFANIPEETRKRLDIQVDGEFATMRVGKKRLRLEIDVANAVAIELYTKEHALIDVKGKDVVDVGAYVDNTAIYYALERGAKHVFAFEPYPYIYRTAVRSVNANALGKMISTYNEAVSGVSGRASLDADFTSFGMVDAGTLRGGKKAVRVVSLDSVAKKLGIRHGALKVDCEGCEYSIFRHASSETLRRFDAIHVEYHYGYRDIVERLRSEGFKVTYTKPAYNFKGFGSRAMLKGDIVAVKEK